MLLDLADIRVRAGNWNLKSIIVSGSDLVFSFISGEGVEDLFARAPGKVRIPDKKTVNIRLTKNYFEPRTLLAVLRKMLK